MKALQGLFLLVLAVVLSVASLLATSAFKWAEELPDLGELDVYEFSATSQIFARDGTTLIGEIVPVLGEDKASTNRIPVSLDEISPAALAAIIASEDDQFFNHYGFDIPALVKATYEEFLGSGGRGGSTITTQVVKNTVLSDIADERSLERKFKELMLATELERRLTKAEILQRYVNVVFWGGNLYGIRAAANAYFDKDPSELNLAEGLYLARLLPSPARHDDFAGVRASMRVVLNNMVAQGSIPEDMADRAWRYPLEPTGWRVVYDDAGNTVEAERTGERLTISSSVSSDLAPHVTFAVRNELLERFGEARVFGSGGLKVYTTIDVQAQLAANEASLRADIPPGTQTAMVGLDPQTGQILAMVGERLKEGQPIGEFNRATSALRQPGSSFKPISYATAIEEGGYDQARVVVDERTVFKQRGQEDYIPKNWDDKFSGAQTIRQHINQSRNIPAVKVIEAVTPEAVAARARELGYTEVQPTLGLSLGSYEVTPLQHAAAFAAFANGGVYIEPTLISKVEDADGNILYEAPRRANRVWSEQTAYVVLDILHANVVDPGALGRRAALDGRWVGGKTGTTNEERDLWFVGITPGMVAAVWVGNDDDTTITNPGGELVTSSRQPIYVWRDFVENALRGKPVGDGFDPPEGIEFHRINLSSGRPDPNGVNAAFVEGTGPNSGRRTVASPIYINIPVDTATNKRATASTPRDRIRWINVDPEDVGRYLN